MYESLPVGGDQGGGTEEVGPGNGINQRFLRREISQVEFFCKYLVGDLRSSTRPPSVCSLLHLLLHTHDGTSPGRSREGVEGWIIVIRINEKKVVGRSE